MSSVGYVDIKIAHANYAFAVYDSRIIGRLENLKIKIDKDVEYDTIIGSGGKPFGNPIVKFTKFSGTFIKAMFKVSDLDKVLIHDSIGNESANYGGSDFDLFSNDFSSADLTRFTDTNKKTLTLYPIALDSFTISLDGVVMKAHEIEVIQNKYIRINGEFIGKSITYWNKTNLSELTKFI